MTARDVAEEFMSEVLEGCHVQRGVNTEQLTYLLAQELERYGDARAREALEQAAQVCVEYSHDTDGAMTALECATRIRALAAKGEGE